jgi:hypothetical protein
MKPFFDSLNAAMSPADFHAIRRMAQALRERALAEHAKVGQYDKSDAIAGLIDNLSQFAAEFDAENEPKGTSTEHLWATTSKVV